MKTLYFDCFAGASGNMILGALVALGIDRNELIEELKKLDIADFGIEFTTKNKAGISAIHADVKVPEEKAHRHLHDIEKIINESRLNDSIKQRTLKIFTKLAEAEAKVHGIELQKVHFHEVGAMDAIIDVVGACIGFEMLGIERFVCSKIHVGSGFVKMAHGKFPVPPPAVAEILQNIPIYSTEIEGELITPTGAAIIAAVCEEFGQIPEMKIEKTAYGAGTRDYADFPNVLRLMVGFQIPNSKFRIETRSQSEIWNLEFGIKSEQLTLLETNIDDISPEISGFVMERAFEAGCLDCWFTPIQMKKNRPAVMISILCENGKIEIFKELLFTETSTLGVRISKIEREFLERETQKIETEFGEIAFKIAKYNGKIVNVKPEYDQMREIAVKSKIPIKEIERRILREIKG